MAEPRPSYVALVAALRAEFNDLQRESIYLQMRGHLRDMSSLGTLASAVRDAHDITFDAGENVHPAVKDWLSKH